MNDLPSSPTSLRVDHVGFAGSHILDMAVVDHPRGHADVLKRSIRTLSEYADALHDRNPRTEGKGTFGERPEASRNSLLSTMVVQPVFSVTAQALILA